MQTTKQDCLVTPIMLENARSIAAKRGARALASSVLSLCVRRRVGGLSIEDLPDLPSAMDFRDDWQGIFESDGISAENLACAISDGFECVDSILAEEGFSDE